jgi:hypothetical protein
MTTCGVRLDCQIRQLAYNHRITCQSTAERSMKATHANSGVRHRLRRD